MSKTFARPLTPKRTDFSFKSFIDDPKGVREAYERLGGNPFGIKPDPPPPTRWFCDVSNCTQWKDERGEYKGQCIGACVYG